MEKVRFNRTHSEFATVLKSRVRNHFQSENISQKGNFKIYQKTIILFTSLVVIYSVLMFVSLPLWASLLLWAALGANFAGIGFNVMHDASHGSYSNRPWVNKLMAYSLNILGGSDFIWKEKHTVNHHTFTNVDGIDDDLDIKPMIRTNTNQKHYWFHKYQHIYSLFLYGMTYLIWVFVQDYKKYFTGKIADTPMKPMNLRQHIVFWTSKLLYYSIFIVLPIIQLGLVHALLGYLVAGLVCGWILAVIFQLAHLVEDTGFPLPDETTSCIETNWVIHQLDTTANFSPKSKIITWFAGGLNFQIEHHLFPNISHIHYPAISRYVKEVCLEFNVPYFEYPTFYQAFKSHLQHLKVVGARA